MTTSPVMKMILLLGHLSRSSRIRLCVERPSPEGVPSTTTMISGFVREEETKEIASSFVSDLWHTLNSSIPSLSKTFSRTGEEAINNTSDKIRYLFRGCEPLPFRPAGLSRRLNKVCGKLPERFRRGHDERIVSVLMHQLPVDVELRTADPCIAGSHGNIVSRIT